MVHFHNSVHDKPFRRYYTIMHSFQCVHKALYDKMTRCKFSSVHFPMAYGELSSLGGIPRWLLCRTYCSKLTISKCRFPGKLPATSPYEPPSDGRDLSAISRPNNSVYSHKQTFKLRYNNVI